MFGKNLPSKSTKDKISVDSSFLNMLSDKKRKLENAANQQKAF